MILSSLSTHDLLALTPVSRRFSSIILSIFHYRLSLAANLDGHTLLLECYHPSARLTSGQLYCDYLGTDGLEDALDYPSEEVGACLGHLQRLYSRFLPHRKESTQLFQQRAIPGDIPGSRTHPSSSQHQSVRRLENGPLAVETVSLEPHELFSQLKVVTSIVKTNKRDRIISAVELSEGIIRVKRDWLADQVQANSSNTESIHPPQDSSILWVNNCEDCIGIKFKVIQRRLRQDNPILYTSEEEVAVSYDLEFEGNPNRFIYVT